MEDASTVSRSPELMDYAVGGHMSGLEESQQSNDV